MPVQRATAEVRETRSYYIPIPGEPGVWHTGYIGANAATGDSPSVSEDDLYPMAYLVEFEADTLIKPHFHVADQFQLVVTGGGGFGGISLWDLSFHYSSAYTAYGPIRAKENGLGYFTLRNGWDPGALWMPQWREKLRGANRPHREVVSPSIDRFDDHDLNTLSKEQRVTMISEPDGLGGWTYRIPANASLLGPNPQEGRGQFWVVLGGSLVGKAGDLERFSCTWISPEEGSFDAKAGPPGAEVILLQFPK